MLVRFSSIDRTLVMGYLMRSYPIAFSTLNILALEAVNTIMISRMGMCHAASAMCINTLFNLFKRINSGISVSVSLLTARAVHKRNYQRVAQILKHALLLNIFFACIFFIVLVGLSFYLELFSRSREIAALGRPYLLILSIALIPSAINTMLRRYLEGLSCEKTGLCLVFFTLVTNILFNFLLIYGKCGFPLLGLKGAGIAIVLSETLTAVVGMGYVRYLLQPNGCMMHLKLNQISWRYIKAILSVGGPVGLQFGIEGAYLLCVTVMVGWISIEAQVAHAILFNICQLITIFAVGLGISGAMYVAQQRGLHNFCLVKKAALTACSMIEWVAIVIGLIVLAISPYIIAIYKPDAVVAGYVHRLIKHLCFFQVFYGVCYWGSSVLRGLDDRIFPFACSAVTQLVGVMMCYSMVVKYNWNISGVWLTLIFERMLLSLLLQIRFEWKTRS